METDLLFVFVALAAWTYLAVRIGRWAEGRSKRYAGTHEPPTPRQLLFLAHLADENEITVPSVRTRAEAAIAIDDLLCTVTLDPAAEIEHRRLADEVPGFEDAYGELAAILSARPRSGRPIAGGSWGYALAPQGKPAVRVRYTFDRAMIRIYSIQATPVEDVPGGEEE